MNRDLHCGLPSPRRVCVCVCRGRHSLLLPHPSAWCQNSLSNKSQASPSTSSLQTKGCPCMESFPCCPCCGRQPPPVKILSCLGDRVGDPLGSCYPSIFRTPGQAGAHLPITCLPSGLRASGGGGGRIFFCCSSQDLTQDRGQVFAE